VPAHRFIGMLICGKESERDESMHSGNFTRAILAQPLPVSSARLGLDAKLATLSLTDLRPYCVIS
jgi:hypothetical protein